jgi:REP element-mobilizing transposase RayT
MVVVTGQGDAGRMARLPRFDLPGIPRHVVQRGNNRLPCFLDDADRQRYLQCLRQALVRFGCRLHAYVLMSNHVHLLLTPTERGAVSRLMHTFSRNYVGLFDGAARAHRDAMGRALQGVPGRFRALLPGMQPLHRTQPGAGVDGRTPGGVSVVQFCRQQR